ncbi:MAG: DMT family transporter [Anaerolineales bacterium]
MRGFFNSHTGATVQALLVTFLWSTSWVLIKLGLIEIPALTFAGLRYGIAFLCLLVYMLAARQTSPVKSLTIRQWGLLFLFGITFFAIVQGVQFFGLAYLPAATISLILNFTSLMVALMGLLWLSEQPGWLGWLGIVLSVSGALVYFYPVGFPASQLMALLIVVFGMFVNAFSGVLGRYINHNEGIPALTVTTVSMGVGSALLLAGGIVLQGMPHISTRGWLIIGWLAVVNTAFAFTLWNFTLRTLEAMESSVINSSMLIQVALLAWIFLGESLSVKEWIGLLLAGFGVLLVQLRSTRK